MKIYKTLILLLLVNSLSAQESSAELEERYKTSMSDPSVNFYEVLKDAEAYFSTIDKNVKGSGWKPFQRWVNANEYKYYPDGDRYNVDPYFVSNQFKAIQKSVKAPKSLFNGTWKDLGPYTMDSLTGHYSAGLGRVEDFYVSPVDSNIIYLGSRSGGFWRTIDGGATWAGTTDDLFASGVNAMGVSPTNSDSILINVRNSNNGTSHGIYRSIDGGLTWVQTLFNPANLSFAGLGTDFQIYELAYHPRVGDLIFIGTNKGIFKSTDNLATWTAAEFNFDFIEIAFHPSNDSILYLYNNAGSSTSDRVFRTLDQGASYSLSNNILGNGGNERVELVTNSLCDDCLWFASNNGIWISYDRGLSFGFRSNSPESCGGFSVNDQDTSNMVYGYVDLDNSVDGGNTFVNQTRWSLGNTNGNTNSNSSSYATSTNYIHADIRNLKSINGVFYAATDGFLSKSNDGGVSWTILSEGTGIRENYKLGISQSNHYRSISGSQDNGTSILTEKGWVEFYGADGMEGLIHPLNEDWMMGSVQYGSRRRTKTGGISQDAASPAGSSGAYWEAPLAYDPNNHMTIYDFRDMVYKSDDFAETHVALGNPSTITGDIQHAEIAQNNSNIIVVARGSAIEKSIDGGVSFSSIKGNLPNYSIRDIAFDPNDDNTIIVVYARYQTDNSKVFMTTNGGTSWSNITHNLGSMPIRSAVIDHSDASNIYLGAEIGVYTKPMSGNNWALYNTGLPNMAVRELEINYGSNTLRAATWGRGLWEYNLVGRQNYPAITYTTITNPPTDNSPKEGNDQYVNSRIDYNGMLSSVYLEWSRDSAVFGNRIAMTDTSTLDSSWLSTQAIPTFMAGTKVYFKVFAVGSTNDTTETYKFMYEVKPFDYCFATGNNGSGNLFIDNVNIENLNNSSVNNAYSNYANPVVELYVDSNYLITVSANTGWGSNDFGVWIDYNANSDFEVNERVLFDPNSGGSSSISFRVPTTVAVNDTVKMRVRLSYWSNPDPCGNQFGEVEDYLIALRDVTTGIENKNITSIGVSIFPNPNEGNFS
ncbi:MAG: hypothetical protein JKY48_12005 [Flavobacteriales bacterium]|nr:hypothetical protein [Flavobacteriales bacterium]